jgi:predicted nucleic acid-binding protein
MRIAFDTNILVYAEFEPDYPKGLLSKRLLKALPNDGLIPAQVIGELFNVTQRRWPHLRERVRRQVEAYEAVFAIEPTDKDIMMAASIFAERYRLQFWDSVIWLASRRAGATILLTEDMQDGFTADGMRAINPFNFADWSTLASELRIPS